MKEYSGVIGSQTLESDYWVQVIDLIKAQLGRPAWMVNMSLKCILKCHICMNIHSSVIHNSPKV